MRRYIAVVFILGCSLASLGPGVPADAAGYFVAAQHNILGVYVGASEYTAEHTRPLMISNQEVCEVQSRELRYVYAFYGYEPHDHVVDRSTGCGEYSVLVATQGQIIGKERGAFQHQAPYDINGGRYKGWACIRARFGGSWVACSLHTAATGADLLYAIAQEREMRDAILGGYYDWYAKIVGGDFNIRPDQNPGVRPDWYPGYNEGDETWHYAGADRPTTREGHPTYPPGVKIDYMFADKFWVNPASGSADIRCTRQATGSDHCFYLASFNFA